MATALNTNDAPPNTSTPVEDRKLSDIFEEAFHKYNAFDQSELPGNSAEFQVDVKKCMHLFEDATRLVSAIGLFSDNESIDEVATNNLKYMLLPYFLGQLSQKLCNDERREVVQVAEVYFKDFLARCELYGLHKPNPERSIAVAAASNGASDKFAELTQMANQRNSKLEQYRLKKELNSEIKKIKLLMERDHIDDTLKREFYLKLLHSSVLESTDELRSLAQESQMLDLLARSQLDNPSGSKAAPRRPAAPLKPIIITKDAFQKAVFGAGYPSLPTMSVDDFYENRVAEGIFPDPNVVHDPNSVQARSMRGEATELDEAEDIQKEADEENDDEVYLARARNMDEFKDEVRRGDGNRHNRS